MLLISKNISISINRSFSEVYDFASNPANMPLWAAGLSGSMMKEGDNWVSISPMGKIEVIFTPRNDFGIMDHDVVLESGLRFHNPLRVIKNNTGADVIFTLFRQPEMSDSDFASDAGMVLSDLQKLKSILEQK